MNRAQLGGAIGSALLAPTLFSLSGPNIAALREQAKDPITRNHLRVGQVLGAVTVVGAGFAATSLSGDNAPLIGAIIGAAAMVAVYEYALRDPKPTADEQAEGAAHTTLLLSYR